MVEKKVSDKISKIRPSGIRRMFDLAQGVPNIISLGIGQPDFDTPDYIKNAMKKALDNKYTGYSPNIGYKELREAIVNKYEEEYDLNYEPNDVIVTCGACEALFDICQAILNEGDEVLVPDPGFLTYPAQVIFAGGIPVPYQTKEEDDFEIKIEEIESKITKKTKMIILNFPNNPTGAVMDKKKMNELIEFIEKKDIFILSDECYEKLIYDNLKHICVPTLGAKNKTFIVNSFSKSYAMTGWRVGYLLAPSEFIAPINLVHQMNTACTNSAAQIACVEALNNKDESLKFIKKMVSEFDKRRKFVFKRASEIPNISCNLTKGAFYFLLNIKNTGLSAQEFSELMITDAKVVTVPGDEFGDIGKDYVRIAYTLDIKKLDEAFNRIENTLNK
ncbi:MAG: pyridoxal phosphate-dependent aminotransferase [Candidatus Helarchaeota archaeon]